MKTKPIQSSEWVLVGSFFLIMASLVLISKIQVARAFSSIAEKDLKKEEIWVSIEGAVAKPGRYSVLSGTPFKEVLRKAKPLPEANLRPFLSSQVVEEPLDLRIDALEEIIVYVGGAVAEPGPVALPPKSRICDLRSKISLTQEADKAFFRRKKRLRDGEKIEVPKKTVEVNSTGSVCCHTDI